MRGLRKLMLASALLVCVPAQATTYRWVDEHGKVHYGDVMPSQQSGRGHSELDKQGRVVRETERTRLSPEERQAREAERARQEAQKQREAERLRQDRALLTTYVSEAEIDLVRDRALELEALRLRGYKSRLNSAAEKLAYANGQIAAHEKNGQVPPPALRQMRDEAMTDLAQTGERIRQRELAMQQVRQRFEADKRRFRELQAVRR